ncbi:MAG TPA: universal stress protein [Nitrospira sp.]|nr:universal stress protein [Nitrospira sp.]
MRILCAVDGSEWSQWGIGMLEALAPREPERVTALHVVDVGPSAAKGRNPVADKRALAAMEKAGTVLLRDAVRSARAALGQAATAPRTKFHSVLARGPIARIIVQQAKRAKADLVIMGSRGLSDVQGFLLGSVSREVVAQARCPVLVVKRPITKLRTVTLAVDDSRHSRSAARFLRLQFLPEDATVTVLASVENPVTELAARYLSASQLTELKQPAIDRAAALVTSLREEFIKDGYSVVTDVRTGHVIETVVRQVEASGADLLVIGARAKTKSERLHLGGVSESLLKYAPCSVLVVRGRAGR